MHIMQHFSDNITHTFPPHQVVLKPAEATPLTALALAALAERAGVPAGVLSVLCGDAPAIGNALLDSDSVRKIGFTGSTRVGKLLMAGAASNVKRVSLELGGNAPFIVFEDADLEQAAAAVVASRFRNAGQTCICTNRVFVHDAVYDAFSQLLVDAVRKLKVLSGITWITYVTTWLHLLGNDCICNAHERYNNTNATLAVVFYCSVGIFPL